MTLGFFDFVLSIVNDDHAVQVIQPLVMIWRGGLGFLALLCPAISTQVEGAFSEIEESV